MSFLAVDSACPESHVVTELELTPRFSEEDNRAQSVMLAMGIVGVAAICLVDVCPPGFHCLLDLMF